MASVARPADIPVSTVRREILVRVSLELDFRMISSLMYFF
jgi:hypothetical protein